MKMTEEKKEMLQNGIDVSDMKKAVKSNIQTLLSVIEASDLFLTELVGEGVMEESIQEEILAQRTRSESNKRLLKWLSHSDDPLLFKVFLEKLRKHRQTHVANLLDGTPGELPLTQAKRQSIQKVMLDLTKEIDPDSGLLDILVNSNIISDSASELIYNEVAKASRTKALMDNILRGSDKGYEKFLEEIVKTQPEVMAIFEKQPGVLKPHADTLKEHTDVLMRCTDINPLTIAYLRSEDVIDDSMEDVLKHPTTTFAKRIAHVYSWLLHKSTDTFDSYIRVMEKNEQKHVANLLKANSLGHQPLSKERYDRLIKIRPDLIRGIYSRGNGLADSLRGKKAGEDTDFAISFTDHEDIIQGNKTDTARNSFLIDAVLRRTDFSFDALEKALRETHQEHMADLLTQGMVVGAHVNTTRPDKEDDICVSLNEKIALQSRSSSNEESLLTECLNELNGFNLPPVAAESQHSIVIFTYCKTPDDMKTYVKLLRTGRLQFIFEDMLNRLLKSIEPENFQPLEVAVTLEEKDQKIIQEFTGLDENQTDVKNIISRNKSCTSGELSMDVSNTVQQDLVEKLQCDVALISDSKSKSFELKMVIENQEKDFLKQMEELEKAAERTCDDLKKRVDTFKAMLMKDHANFKEQHLKIFAVKRRAIESFVAVYQGYENYAKQLVEEGSAVDVCQSFADLHERINKLRKLTKPAEITDPAEITEECVIKNKSFLEEYMDPDCGLLQQLLDIGALSNDELDEIANVIDQDKNRKILDILLKKNKCKDLRVAFVRTKQVHLVNYLCSGGEYKPHFRNDWPVLDDEKIILDSKKEELTNFLEVFDLLTLLLSMGVINSQQKKLISSKATPQEKCDALLSMLKRGNLSNFLNITNLRPVLMQMHPLLIHRKFLEDFMDPDSGLLDQSFLPKKELRIVKNERTRQKKIAKLLDFVIHGHKYSELMTALENTKQAHIVNFVKSNGVYNPEFGDNWPLTEEVQIIEENKTRLVNELDSRTLLDALFSKDVITKKQMELILQKKTRRERNEALLNYVKRGNLKLYSETVECLKASNQMEIAQILDQVPVQVNVTIQVSMEKEEVELIFSICRLLAMLSVYKFLL